MLNITQMDNGDLLIQACNDMRQEIADMIANGRDYWSIMADLFESHACNGSYTHFNAGDANPFVGLTSAPCIAETMIVHDDGQCEIDGQFWYFSNYVTELETKTLKNKGRVIYTLAR